MYTKAVLLAVFLALAATEITGEKKIVCYYGNWVAYYPEPGKLVVSDIDATKCTHLIYSYIGLNNNDEIIALEPELDLPSGENGFGKFNKLRESNPNLKTLVAIGGPRESWKLSVVAQNPELRAKFAKDAVNFVKTYHFDGLAFDWEYPNNPSGSKPIDVENYVQLVKELRKAFDKEGPDYILSVAVVAAEHIASESYNIPEISKHVDFINLIAFDYHSYMDGHTGYNAPLYGKDKLNVNASVQYWLDQGAPKEKLILGVPFHGKTFTLVDSKGHWLEDKVSGPMEPGPYTGEAGILGYNEICKILKEGDWSLVLDGQQHVPYAYKDKKWIGYDDVKSIKEKARYIKSMGLGGVMVGSIAFDDFRGTCSRNKYPLLRALNQVLRKNQNSKPDSTA